MKKYDFNYVYIALLAAVFFLPFLGNIPLFDWDEINFAECAREMLATGNYLRPQINFAPFWEKPPLFIWFQAISMYFFGINEYAARLPNAICGIVTLLTIYHLGKKLYDKTLVGCGFWLTSARFCRICISNQASSTRVATAAVAHNAPIGDVISLRYRHTHHNESTDNNNAQP